MSGEARGVSAPGGFGRFAPTFPLPGRLRPNIYYPTLADPRFISVVLLLGLDLYALATPSFGRRSSQWAVSVFSWVVLDSLLLIFYRRLLLVPLSGFVPALAAFVLVDSPHHWPYAAVGAAAVLSKHFIRIDGRHIFNPLNFGLVAALLFFGESLAFGTFRFGDSPWLFLWVGTLGILVAGRCRRLDIAFAYAGTFLLGAGARSLLSEGGFLTAASSATNIVFYMFAFHMMTDPKTTPDSRSHRIVFGAVVGVLDAALRFFGVVNAPLYALFLISGALPFFRAAEGRVPDSFIWKLRAYRLTDYRAAAAPAGR